MIRQAVILAAGAGKRMGSELPKPLLEINKVPMIERNISKLAERNVEIAVVVNPNDEHLFKEKLRAYRISYYHQSERLGTANALFAAKDFVRDDTFLVMMGDDLTDYDIDELLKTDKPAVFVYEVDDVSGYGAVITNAKGEVEDIIEKEKRGRGRVNTGIYAMPKIFFKYYEEIPINQKNGEYYLTLAPKILAKHGVIFKLKRLSYWLGVNTQEDLKKANEHLEKH